MGSDGGGKGGAERDRSRWRRAVVGGDGRITWGGAVVAWERRIMTDLVWEEKGGFMLGGEEGADLASLRDKR